MKVALITRHAVANYGSLLQAMATQKVIEAMGHSCRVIDYVREDESYRKRELTLLKRKPSWYNNPLKRYLYLALRQPESILAGRKFEKAQKQYLNLTRRYSSPEELAQDQPEADVYLTGSDQVWGPTENGSYDSSYCLSFTKDSDKRIAYAASFGHTDMTGELESYFQKWLGRYRHIALREDSAVKLLDQMGMAAHQVLDPTLLLDQKDWEPYIGTVPEKKYILVYQLHNDRKLTDYARRAAKEMGLPLIRVSATLHQFSRGGSFRYGPDIGTFLAYIRGAACMITDSFHGTAFAINFGTPFVEVLPNNNTGTRNMSILTLTGLSDRILRDSADVALAAKKMDFTHAHQVLEKERKRSKELLKRMIEE